jgi:hypothetical protein
LPAGIPDPDAVLQVADHLGGALRVAGSAGHRQWSNSCKRRNFEHAGATRGLLILSRGPEQKPKTRSAAGEIRIPLLPLSPDRRNRIPWLPPEKGSF